MRTYKIVVDSCCEIPEEIKNEILVERVPLTLEVGDTIVIDDDNFDQASFLKMVDECPTAAKSACPSPERYMEAFDAEVERVYVVTLTSKLSGSYNSAILHIFAVRKQFKNLNLLIRQPAAATFSAGEGKTYAIISACL